eukprot:TRINITY_DN49166_c0_g1_i1.p1 TRINITY_DN49166_c0_g1~~TRINITY_DN49166_c0_g1_i1.p1  ORF type:complete len:293 (+),score=41.36 TRINITY_DN49166_c0_g1_i1:3-881(+)
MATFCGVNCIPHDLADAPDVEVVEAIDDDTCKAASMNSSRTASRLLAEAKSLSRDKESDESDKLKIFAVMLSGKSIMLDLKAYHTGQDVRAKIQEKEGIPQCQQYLIFEGQELHDHLTLSECNVTNMSQIQIIRSMYKICVKNLTGKTLDFEVGPLLTIYDLKEMIQKLEAIPLDMQGLVFNKQRLEDSRTLQFYNIQNDSTLFLVLRLGSIPMTLNVALAEDEVVTVSSHHPHSVDDLRSQLEAQLHTQLEDKQFVFGDRVLLPGHSLLEYDIQPGSTVFLVDESSNCSVM